MARNAPLAIALTFICLLLRPSRAQGGYDTGPSKVLTPGFGFSWVGCYRELHNARALAEAQLLVDQVDITVEICAQFCSAYTFMGVEFGVECYCANSVANASRPVTTESGLTCDDSQYACAGNANQQCGGFQAIDLYAKAGATTTTVPPQGTGFTYVMDSFIVGNMTNSQGAIYNYIGCYNDPTADARALQGSQSANGESFTVDTCSDYCAGYTYFGLENGGSCYCGNSIDNGAAPVPCQDECYQCCADDLSQRCGGYFRLSMYELDAPAYVDPSPDAVCSYNGPVTAIPNPTGGLESYTYYGPITTASTAVPVVTTNAQGATESYTRTEYYCDGGNCLPNPHTPGGSITATNYPSVTAAPTNKPEIFGCRYLDCYDDNGGGRALYFMQTQLPSANMTAEACVAACLAGGYSYAGLEYGSQCFCDSLIGPGHAPVLEGSVSSLGTYLSCLDPRYVCTGDPSESCGGYATIEIYYCEINDPNPDSTLMTMVMPPTTTTGATASAVSISTPAAPVISSTSDGPAPPTPTPSAAPVVSSSAGSYGGSGTAGASSASSRAAGSGVPTGGMMSMGSGSPMSTRRGMWSGSACTRRTSVFPVSASREL